MKTYTIRDLSKQFNLKPSTLRYYEDLGPGLKSKEGTFGGTGRFKIRT